VNGDVCTLPPFLAGGLCLTVKRSCTRRRLQAVPLAEKANARYIVVREDLERWLACLRIFCGTCEVALLSCTVGFPCLSASVRVSPMCWPARLFVPPCAICVCRCATWPPMHI